MDSELKILQLTSLREATKCEEIMEKESEKRDVFRFCTEEDMPNKEYLQCRTTQSGSFVLVLNNYKACLALRNIRKNHR